MRVSKKAAAGRFEPKGRQNVATLAADTRGTSGSVWFHTDGSPQGQSNPDHPVPPAQVSGRGESQVSADAVTLAEPARFAMAAVWISAAER